MEKQEGEKILRLQSLNTFYGKAHILFDLNLEMKRGEVGALLGRNGMGKSTTLKSIMGLVAPKSGEIFFKGRPIRSMPPYKRCSLGLGYVPEDRRVFTRLTIMENLEVGSRRPLGGLEAWTPENLFQIFPSLGAIKNRLGGQLSGGEQQMLTIARTLMGNPEAIMLDEPSEGLAPIVVDQLHRIIKRLKEKDVSVLLAEQNLNFARMNCERVFIMEHGSVRFHAPIGELTDEVCETYLAV